MKNIKSVILTAAFLTIPFAASANMIWPSIFLVELFYAWYIILIGLIIEIIAAHIFLKTDWKKSVITMVVTNLVSAILGLLLIPISGLAVELLFLPFGGGTFDATHWVMDFICMVLGNTCVEGWALMSFFKYPFKSNFPWLLGANFVSVLINLVLIIALNYLK
ncbi:MAG: hypothetical protein K2M55_09080 [Muribaculaceae bacterium]|nr:hypothetical protein [Muribaculaceae bacterium]